MNLSRLNQHQKISIPTGTIKSFTLLLSGTGGKSFQFLLVRLKGRCKLCIDNVQ